MTALSLYLTSLFIIFIYSTFFFFVAQQKKDNSIMDVAYGPAFIFTALALSVIVLQSQSLPAVSVILLLLIIIWGVRLSYRIYKRNKPKGEDFRYKAWRSDWMMYGKNYFLVRSYLQIFMLQGFIVSIILLPFTLSLGMDTALANGFALFFLLGLLVWIFGFFFEVVGDKQLDTWVSRKHLHGETIMKKGLWKYTRHPNYFGESMMWVGISLVAFSVTMSLYVFLSPFLITGLLLFVSGVPMLERRWEGNHEWEEYKKHTSVFIPLPPKRG